MEVQAWPLSRSATSTSAYSSVSAAGRPSMAARYEEEVHDILRATLGQEKAPVKNLGTALHELFKPFGGVELDIPPREPMREPPRFD